MRHNYDTIASFYDLLAKLVYGKTLVKAQVYLIQAIPANSSVLIIGGGTGWILDEITRVQPSGLSITYVDSSAKMIELARARNVGVNAVDFVAAPIETISPGGRYDVVFTPFLLDNFTDKQLEKVFSLLDGRLRPGGMWLYCDFQNTQRLWQRALLEAMYVFFRVFCGIPASRLPDAEGCFSRYRYEVADRRTFMSEFVVGVVYRKG